MSNSQAQAASHLVWSLAQDEKRPEAERLCGKCPHHLGSFDRCRRENRCFYGYFSGPVRDKAGP